MRAHARLALLATTGLAAATLTGCSTISDILSEQTVQEFTVGECLDTDGVASEESFEVGEIPVVECTEAHDAEVFYVVDTAATEFDEDALFSEADEYCYANFESYVGVDYESSSIYYSAMYPTSSSWELGDRELVCLLTFDEDVVDSYKGSGV